MRSKSADSAVLLVFLSVGVMLIVRQHEVAEAVISAVESCVYRIIPSLFAMSVISTAISKSGVLAQFTRKFRINADILAAFVFGNIGGYPIGAKLLSEAVTEGRLNREVAEKAMTFCFGAGPSFAAGVVGATVFSDIRVGIAALFASISANFTLYLIFLFRGEGCPRALSARPEGFSTRLLTDSVSAAVSAMKSICSMIVFFAALKAIAEATFPSLAQMKYFAILLEISNISACQGISLVAASVLLAFGGICVNMQIFAAINGIFSLKRFYMSRIVSLPLTALYAYLIQRILPNLGIAAETATKIRLSQSPSLIPIVCVAAMVAITLREHNTDFR